MLSLLGIEAGQAVSTARRRIGFWAAIGVLALFAVVFLLVALNSALSQLVGPVESPLLCALACALVALVVFIVMTLQDAAAKRKEAERRKAAETTALVSTAILGALPTLLKSPVLRQVGIPVAVAFASALLLRKRSSEGDEEP